MTIYTIKYRTRLTRVEIVRLCCVIAGGRIVQDLIAQHVNRRTISISLLSHANRRRARRQIHLYIATRFTTQSKRAGNLGTFHAAQKIRIKRIEPVVATRELGNSCGDASQPLELQILDLVLCAIETVVFADIVEAVVVVVAV